MTNNQSRMGFGLMANIVIIFTVVSLIAVIIFFLKPVKEKTIKIGCLLTLSGAGEAMAKDVLDGLIFAGDELNSWGGINGKKIEFVIEDTKSNPEYAKSVFRKMEARHHPVIFISNMSSVGVAIASLAEEFQVPLVGLITSTGRLTPQNSWAFRYWSSAETEANALLAIIQKLNLMSIGVLNVGDEYGRSVTEIVLKQLEKTDARVIHREFIPSEKQFAPFLDEMAQMESILAFGYPPNITGVAQEISKMTYKGKMIYSNVASRPDISSVADVQGAYVPAPLIYKHDYLYAKEAGEKFKAQYKRLFNHYSANSYDFIRIFSHLMSGKDISRITVKSALTTDFMYSGVYGEVHLKAGERDMSFEYYPARIVNGKIEFME